MSRKKVLIFGGSGFIGSHFAEYLSSQTSVNVLLFDLKEKPGVEELDVRESISIDEEFDENDIIINLAAVHTTPGHEDYEYFETNIKGAENVCDFAEKVGIRNIIFTSSIAPYGAGENEKTETTLTTPNTPYGISKLIAEYIHKEWASKNDKRRLMILRPGVVFGRGENGNFTRLAAAIDKGVFFYPGRRDTIKACIYVKELVFQTWTLFDKQEVQCETYNFSYFPSYSIREIAGTIAEVIDKKKPKLLVSAKILMFAARIFKLIGLASLGIHPDRVKKLMISTNISGKKLKEKLIDYKYTFKEGIEDWYKNNDSKGLS